MKHQGTWVTDLGKMQGGRRAGIGSSKWWNPYSQHRFTLCQCSPGFNVTEITRARTRTPPPPRTWLHSGQHACASPRTRTHSARLRGPDGCPTFLVPCSSSFPFLSVLPPPRWALQHRQTDLSLDTVLPLASGAETQPWLMALPSASPRRLRLVPSANLGHSALGMAFLLHLHYGSFF